MTSIFDKLNLRPQERRLVVGIALAVFAVVNLIWVWPHFFDWRAASNRITDSKKKLAAYQLEVSRTNVYQKRLKELESTGSNIASEEQALELQRTVRTTSMASGVAVSQYTPVTTARPPGAQANPFFEESVMRITFSSGTPELVNFLVTLATGSSIIRVSDLTLSTDQNQTRLKGSMTLVASYQKKASKLAAPAKARRS